MEKDFLFSCSKDFKKHVKTFIKCFEPLESHLEKSLLIQAIIYQMFF